MDDLEAVFDNIQDWPRERLEVELAKAVRQLKAGIEIMAAMQKSREWLVATAAMLGSDLLELNPELTADLRPLLDEIELHR